MSVRLLALLTLALTLLFGVASQAMPEQGRAGYADDPFGVYFYPGEALVGAQQMAEAGVVWAHRHLDWATIEANQGIYNWQEADRVFQEGAAWGFRTIVTVSGNPSWAAASYCGPIYPQHLPDFARFMAALVARYSVSPYNVLHWAIYNEPDNSDAINLVWLGGCWGRAHPNHAAGAGGAAYANMLSYVYPAIKAANPQAQVLLGGLAYENWWDPPRSRGPFDPYFLDEVLAAGGGRYFDIINFHYYPAWAWVWDNGRYNNDIIFKANYIRQEVRNGAGMDKPIFCTETGHPTSGPASDNIPYNDELSARYVWQENVRAMAAGVAVVIWFEAIDEPWLRYTYGLLRTNFAPKPAYQAYRTMVAELSGATLLQTRIDLPDHVEGYDLAVGGMRKTVLWTRASQTVDQSLQLAAPGGMLRVLDKFGAASQITDGGTGDKDGRRDGWVRLSLDGSPRLVQDLSQPTPTPSATLRASPTPSPTRTPSPTPTFTRTPSPTPTPTRTPSPTRTRTPTRTPSPTATPSFTPTATPSFTPTATPSATPSETPSETPTATATPQPHIYYFSRLVKASRLRHDPSTQGDRSCLDKPR